jgi:hypothetical protein
MAQSQDIRCPLCQSFVVRLKADHAEVGARCLNRRCRAPVAVEVVGGKLTVKAVSVKQAT